MKIDIYPHILLPKYKEALYKQLPSGYPMKETLEAVPTLTNLDLRFRIMDKYDVMQVLTTTLPPVEAIADPKISTELARIANDEMAEVVAKYPYHFVAGVATLPMNDIEAALEEADRAIKDLKFRGVLLWTHINGKPLDSPEFMPLYEKMASYNLPIWIHPRRERTVPDYSTEKTSRYQIYSILGWPYETSVAMTRLVFSGILEKNPSPKFITHHCGGMIPYFEQRIEHVYNITEMQHGVRYKEGLTRPLMDYFRMFYNDTAVCGSISALMCGYTFFGADHILFGTDMPYDVQHGYLTVRETIRSIEQLDIPSSDKKKIFEDNARQLLRLPI